MPQAPPADDGRSVPGDGLPVDDLGDDVLAVDTGTAGMSQVTAGYLIAAPRPTLIECGPARSIDNVVAALRSLGMDRDDLAFVVVTHVHLDHAGGAGDLAEAFPAAQVVVSEVGAPHLHDPERLNASSRRVYGELFDEVYGPCTPIDEQRIHAVSDGDVLDLGGGRRLELLYTPGHAKHHIGVHDSDSGAVFAGDSVGVRLPGMRHIRPATPPSDFHLGAALDSLERYRRRDPSAIHLAHYGTLQDPGEALGEAEERLRAWAETAEAAYREHDELDHVVETLRARFADELTAQATAEDPEAAERLELLSGIESNAAGLLRWLRRRDAGTLTPVG